MIKTGIYKLDQLRGGGKTLIRKELKNVSITLYGEASRALDSDEIAERILLLFSDDRGAYKRTYQNRFEDHDRKIMEIVKSLYPPTETLFLHDAGVSDGRTALDFFETISTAFPDISYTASDYAPYIDIIKGKWASIAISPTGKLLEILFPPFVFNTVKRDSFRHYPLNHLIRFCVEKLFINSMIHEYRSGHLQADKLCLFAPQILRKAAKDTRLKLERHNLLHPFENTYHIIRVMNVLNSSYFSEAEFDRVFNNLYHGLKDNGLLIIGSNQEAGTIVHGNIYQKCHSRFQELHQSGDGTSIGAQITNLRQSS